MSAPHKFQDLKQLLAELEAKRAAEHAIEGGKKKDEPEDLPFEIMERIHTLCAKFLGGSWKDVPIQDLILNRMRGGMSNMLFMCKLPRHFSPRKGEPDKTLMRVYFNPETESHLVAESVIFTLLSERQLGPQLFGIFKGGRLEEYIESRPLKTWEIRNSEISNRIARKLAKVHQLSVPIEKDAEYLCDALERWSEHLLEVVGPAWKPVEISTAYGFKIQFSMETLHEEIDTIRFLAQLDLRRGLKPVSVPVYGSENCTSTFPQDMQFNLLTMHFLVQEAKLIRKCIARSHSPILFCHNDLQEGNILLPAGDKFGVDYSNPGSPDDNFLTRGLVFIDFEYASYNYRAFDFANHFAEWSIDYGISQPPYFVIKESDYPSVDEQEVFFRSYLESERESEPGVQVCEATIERLKRECRSFLAVSHFFWGVWALLQLEISPVEFGFLEYGRQRLGLYFKHKPAMMSLLNQEPMPLSPVMPRVNSLSKRLNHANNNNTLMLP